jgi:hypothetical protein
MSASVIANLALFVTLDDLSGLIQREFPVRKGGGESEVVLARRI